MGCIVQVVNLSGTCLCVSGVVSGFPAPISRAVITSATFADSGTNIFASGIAPINPPCFEIIEASYEGPQGASNHFPIISITNGAVTIPNMQPRNIELDNTAFFTPGGILSGNVGFIQHTQILLDSGDIMNIAFNKSSTWVHILRIVETNLLVGR